MKNNAKNKILYYPVALTIAGSDSSGGAGIQVDLRSFNAYGVYGFSAITAITAQNPNGVIGIEAISPDIVAKQIEAVATIADLKFVKSGMLFNSEIIKKVTASIKKFKLKLVLDPVMVATSGAVLLEKDAIQTLINDLIPCAYLITPNIPEAELLLNKKIKTMEDMVDCARQLAEKFNVNVLLKAGHFRNKEKAVDIAVLDGVLYKISSPFLKGCNHAHGTGCTLSSAICANLAVGKSLSKSITEAKSFVLGSLAEPVRIGEQMEVMYPPENDFSEYVTMEKIA